MIQEYAVVRLKRVAPTIPLPVGTKGTILMVYPNSAPTYEVEFFDDAKQEYVGVYAVDEAYLEEVKTD